MKSIRYLPELKRLRGEVQRSASKGERILGSLFPGRGTGWPGGWSQDRVEQSLHLRNWVFVAVDLICSKLASVFPNIAYVTDQPVPGHTVKAGQRGLLNVMGRGFGGSPYVGGSYRYGDGQVNGSYVGTAGWDPRAAADAGGMGFGSLGGGHSFLTVGEYRSKALSVVKPHEELEPLEAGHMLRRLIQNPNSWDTYFSYTYEKWMFGELCGVHYEWLVPGPWGKPAERWVIPSHWVWPRTGGGRVPDGGARDRMRRNGATTYEWDAGQEVGDAARYRAAYVPADNPYADRLIQYYEVRPWGGMGSAGVLRIPPNEIVMTRWPSPINKIDGYSKLAAVAQWIDTEESISRSRWSQFQNQARPEFWVQLPPGYDDADDNRIARIEAKFANKFLSEGNYGKPIFTSAGTMITPLSFNPSEMAYFQSEDQIRDMTLSTWRVPPAAVGIVKEMTFGSILATLAGLCTYCLNPRLGMSGETDTKFLASRWDEETPAYSNGYEVLGDEDREKLYEGTVLVQGGGIVTRGNGGARAERKIKIFYDDCVPADPAQVNSDLVADNTFYAVTPNEVRALRGRKPYRYGGNNPIVQGPAGPMPLPLNDREEELDELAQLAQPMAALGQEGGGEGGEGGEEAGTGQEQPGQGEEPHGQGQGSPQLTNGRGAGGTADETAGGGSVPPAAGGQGRPLPPGRYQQDFEDELVDAGLPPEEPNGKPQKSIRKSASGERVLAYLDRHAMSNPGYSRWVSLASLPTAVYRDWVKSRDTLLATGKVEVRGGDIRRANIPPGFYDQMPGLKSNGVTKSRFLDYHAARTLPEHADEVVAEVRQAAAGKTGPQFASWCKDELRVTVSGSRANMLTQAINYVNRAAMSQAQVRFGHEGGVAKGFTWGGVRLTLPLTTLAMADFVKLPDGVEGTNCMNCRYQSQGQCWFPDLAGQEVNERTCCKFWDAPGTGRPWQQEQVKGYQWVHPGVAKGLGPHKFSTTQLDLVGDALQNVLDLQDLILPEDLAGDGKEAQPHVTVVYGLHTDDPREVQPYVRSFGPVGLTLGKVSYFPATEHSDGAEPVIIEVGGERVRDLRNVIIQAVPNTQNFPDYKPHVTLAYVRAGKGAEYAARLGGLEDLPVTITTLTFNDRSGTSTPLPLVPHAIPPERIERRKAVDPETGDPLEELPAGRKDPVKIHLPELRQGTNYSCGASALQAVCEFFGVGPQEEEAFIKLLPSDPDNGTDPSKVIALAHKLGLDVAAHQGMGIDDLKKLVDRGQPVMVLVQAWYEDYGKADLASDEDGHYVVVIGYDADNLYFADPAVKGARSELPPDEFLERWHDKGGDGRPYVRYGIAFWRPSYAEPMKGVKSNDGAGLGQSGTGDAEACTPGTIRRAGGGGGDRVAVGGPARPVARKVDGPRNLLGVK